MLPSEKSITLFVLFTIALSAKSMGEQINLSTKVQTMSPTAIFPYPPPEDRSNTQLFEGIAYPPPVDIIQPTSSDFLHIPADRIVIVTSNGKIEDLQLNSMFDIFTITNEDGSQAVPPHPGNVQGDRIPPEDPKMERIIGTDDRVKITNTKGFPWRAVAQIKGNFIDGQNFLCSGWMLGPSTVVTAGHCIYSRSVQRFAYNVTIIPGYNGEDSNSTPYGKCTTLIGKVLSPWFINGDIGYDYGVYKLACRVGEVTGNLGFRTTAGTGVGIFEAVVGYPGDKGGETMWSGGGFIISSNDWSFYYDNDTMGGQSGGPVWVTDPNCNPCAIA
ncbi:MAG: trypsin-like serine protease, partial [Chloroflexota bacterium]